MTAPVGCILLPIIGLALVSDASPGKNLQTPPTTTATELRNDSTGNAGTSPSPPLEERAGERRPFRTQFLNSTAVPPTRVPAHAPLTKFATNIADWHTQRIEIRKTWEQFLGAFPTTKVPLRTEIKTVEHLDGFSRSLVRYQIEQGIFTDGYLLEPQSLTGSAPAVVVFHPTTPLQAKGVAGVDASYDKEKQSRTARLQNSWRASKHRMVQPPPGTSVSAGGAVAEEFLIKQLGR